jgi:2-polyprenyl-3-methyl-5-hydroxy-6-metoxy-1,4-benzoquinol methylase
MQEQRKALLIGNGPSALARKAGKEVDSFDGVIVRFNNYTTKGFEEYVGSRTDIWVAVADFPPRDEEHKERYFFSWRDDEKTSKTIERIKAMRISKEYGKKTGRIMKFNHPSLGAIATTYFLDHGYVPYLWGFDFLENTNGRKHHYNEDGGIRGEWHDSLAEWYFFNRCVELGRCHWFGIPEGESMPRVRKNIECGKDDDVSFYRESAHGWWYDWFGKFCEGKSVLDVGAGLGDGINRLLAKGAKSVDGIDVDDRLKMFGVKNKSLEEIESKSYDIVTAVEVLEHVREDLVFMNHLKRIAREKVMITTPSYMRSRCWNHAHCREYTIPQFVNIFKPDEVWSASPNGQVHRTLLLERSNGAFIDHSPEGLMNKRKVESLPVYKDKIPWNLPFDQTVDGEEWPCICGIFNLQ